MTTSYKLDAIKQLRAQKKLERSLTELDAVKLALEMPLDKMVGYARCIRLKLEKSYLLQK